MKRLRLLRHIALILSCFISQQGFAQASGAVQLLGHFVSPSGGAYVGGSWGWTDTVSGREYALLGNYCGMAIVEITNTEAMVERDFIPGPCSTWREIQTYSHYAYIVSEAGGGTQIVDLSYLPDSAHLVKNYTFTGAGGNTSRGHTVHIKDGYMYINGGSYSAGGIVIFSLADPVNPVFKSAYENEYIHDCFVRNDTIYGAAIYGQGIDIIDVTNKMSPQHLYYITYPGAGTHNTATTDDGKYVLSTDEIGTTAKTLKIWSLMTPPTFPKVAEYVGNPSAIVHNTFVKGNLAIMSYYTAGLKIIDISDPTQPVEVGGYDTYSGADGSYDGAWSTYPFFPSGKITIGDMSSGLYVVKINANAPNSPSTLNSYSDYQTPNSIMITWDDPTTLVTGASLSNFTIHIYRNGQFAAQVDSGVEMYADTGLVKHQYYTYSVRTITASDSSSVTTTSAYAGGSAYPNPPTNFSVRSVGEGIELSWKNPSKQTDGTPLNDIAFVDIFRDNVLYDSVAQVTADTGMNKTYTDSVHGYHAYSIRARDNELPNNTSTLSVPVIAYGGVNYSIDFRFEQGIGDIYKTGNWDTTQSISAGGIASITDSPYGSYSTATQTYVLLPPIVVSPDMALQFKHIAIIASDAYGFVEISTDNKSFSFMGLYNVLDHAQWNDGQANAGDWVKESISLDGYVGDTVFIRFILKTYSAALADGWYIDDIYIGPTLTSSFAVPRGWNMISVPVEVVDGRKTVIFPSAVSNAFAYENGYAIEDTLKNTIGYWLKFQNQETVDITGITITADTFNVKPGWNMIGSVSGSVATSSIGSIPGGLVVSQFFGYSGGYTVTDSVKPGRAYWIKVQQDGQLVLSATMQIPSHSKVNIVSTSERPPYPPEESAASNVPSLFLLQQNYPDPFNPTTLISYQLPKASHVRLVVYDMLGREVRTLVNENSEAGFKSVTFDAGGLPSGLYFYRISAGTFSDVKKMILIK